MGTVPLGREGHAEGRRRVCHAGDGQAGAGGIRGFGLLGTQDTRFRRSGLGDEASGHLRAQGEEGLDSAVGASVRICASEFQRFRGFLGMESPFLFLGAFGVPSFSVFRDLGCGSGRVGFLAFRGESLRLRRCSDVE